tara:strand:+ start:1265 stop:1453 length:189 start_codon:yes stop_codon:yes gene_type:complete
MIIQVFSENDSNEGSGRLVGIDNSYFYIKEEFEHTYFDKVKNLVEDLVVMPMKECKGMRRVR